MYVNNILNATFYKIDDELDRAAHAAEQLVRRAVRGAMEVEEIHVRITVVGRTQLRPGE